MSPRVCTKDKNVGYVLERLIGAMTVQQKMDSLKVLTSPKKEEEESKEPAREQLPEKEYDANGNEVISTNEDIWKTNVEVEHTENEKMDDFINQLFM